VQGSELLRLVDAIHRERNVDKEVLFQALEHALLTAVRKKLGESARIAVTIDRETGDTRIVGPDGDMQLADLGRIAAQTAKQVFGQILREAEREVIFSEFDRFQRALVTGTVYRLDGTAVIVNLGRTEGYLPKHEQVRGETYRVGDRILCYVVDVKKIGNRVKIILSRSHPDMLRRLFEREIPEIADGVVDIVQLVREAGYKTKAACSSMDPKVDPIGACVGVRGTRIRNNIDELNGEKIDIIRWSDSPEELMINALKPAQINSITLFEDVKKAMVVVDEDQLSLAIGKKGANVRLASKLAGWDIDILSEQEARERGLFDSEEGDSEEGGGETDEDSAGTSSTAPPSTAPPSTGTPMTDDAEAAQAAPASVTEEPTATEDVAESTASDETQQDSDEIQAEAPADEAGQPEAVEDAAAPVAEPKGPEVAEASDEDAAVGEAGTSAEVADEAAAGTEEVATERPEGGGAA
jgi:N utilization substance protein A